MAFQGELLWMVIPTCSQKAQEVQYPVCVLLLSAIQTLSYLHFTVNSSCFDIPANTSMFLLVLRYFVQHIHVERMCLPLKCATTVAEHQEDYTLCEDNQRLNQHCWLCLLFSMIPKGRTKVGCSTFPEIDGKKRGWGVGGGAGEFRK